MDLTLTFSELHIREDYVARLNTREITTASPVQAEAIPAALDGRDVLAQSQTGTGKTLAYLLPVLMKLRPEEKRTQAVVVAPTQELAMQIVREAEFLVESTDIRVLPLIGGAALHRQVDKLKLRPELVVGTPGRIRELVEMKKLKIHEVSIIVIDEVDHVLQQGGGADMDIVLNRAPRDRQLLFFSATVPDEVRGLADKWMQDPVYIGIDPDKRVADTIVHSFFVTEEREKIDMLRKLVRHWEPKRALVFVNDSSMIGEWEAKLRFAKMSVASLYGDAPKQERVRVLRQFREGEFQLLLATDVAARGLDIPELPFVFSLQPAIDAEHYVHRAGRTGRMGRKGVSVNLITEKERFIMRKFQKQLNIVMHEQVFNNGHVQPVEQMKKPAKPQPKRNAAVKSVDNKKSDRHRDRKNKGAPKWLKEKRGSSPSK
ncbi:DEAD/DEAH box helicase [Paenibacillus sp. 1001270B_150601_E10]|uniref:DEAD/DEAH box helicase n=1 Tax=Paenibacillus sp. 1001270B_150601_E10 TaxID=2787079 RepID=UPI00189FAFC1|nr:DEAD/DEAH box helicase [Paenibacillus sp. 1001270B_150601_E10]